MCNSDRRTRYFLKQIFIILLAMNTSNEGLSTIINGLIAEMGVDRE